MPPRARQRPTQTVPRPRGRPRGQSAAVAERADLLERIEDRDMSPATQARVDAAIDESAITGEPIRDPSIVDDDYDDDVGTVAGAVHTRVDALKSSTALGREYRFRLLHRMLVRQLPMDMIARSLDVTVRQVYYMREELRKQLRMEAVERDLPTFVGMTDGFYNDVIGMAMREATQSGKPTALKLSAMRTAMQAQRDRIDMYEKSGFFSALRLTPAAGVDDEHAKAAQDLIEMSRSMMDVFEMTEEEYDQRNADRPADKVFKDKKQDDDLRVRVL